MAVVSHHGESFDTGHYTAFVRYQSPNPHAANTHVWFSCHDTEVKKVQQKTVLEDGQGYPFFYSRRTDQPRREIFRVVRSTGNVGEQPALQPALCSALRHVSRRARARKWLLILAASVFPMTMSQLFSHTCLNLREKERKHHPPPVETQTMDLTPRLQSR